MRRFALAAALVLAALQPVSAGWRDDVALQPASAGWLDSVYIRQWCESEEPGLFDAIDGGCHTPEQITFTTKGYDAFDDKGKYSCRYIAVKQLRKRGYITPTTVKIRARCVETNNQTGQRRKSNEWRERLAVKLLRGQISVRKEAK